ncbi:hypothetical protein ABEB36_001538 [Hypothenemus hampei]|uniref:NTF2 domain-containing protein n=1 Tax=Hypothenemus hampei TaxID=57062 RepID=A0ABD1FEV9_HYPHA
MAEASEGLCEVLSKLDYQSLFALSKTVTQGLKRCDTNKDAIENIIKYSPDYLSILRRKAVTKEILFNYLESNNVKVQLPKTKNELIDLTMDYWKDLRTANEDKSTYVEIGKSESNVNQMAEHFARWFYPMLNNNECIKGHFFPDAILKLNTFANNDCDSTEVQNDPEEISNTLLNLKQRHRLYFNFNDTPEGIQGRMDPHGLVMVLVCGTLHIESVCAGVFEQVFALARDPCSDNNWKIKRSELNLRSQNNVLECPKLTDSELTSGLLLLPIE